MFHRHKKSLHYKVGTMCSGVLRGEGEKPCELITLGLFSFNMTFLAPPPYCILINIIPNVCKRLPILKNNMCFFFTYTDKFTLFTFVSFLPTTSNMVSLYRSTDKLSNKPVRMSDCPHSILLAVNSTVLLPI